VKTPGLAFALFAAASAQAAPAATIEGTWHVSNAHVAPWVAESAPQPDTTTLLGRNVVFGPGRVDGPGALACANARYEFEARPLDGLFQGNLPAPVKNSAARIGLVQEPVPSVTMNCDTGLFDLHFATPDALLLGLDNVVWVLDRSPGALAAADTPEHTVQALLEDHFAHGLQFTPERARAQKRWFSAALAQKIDAYFAQDFPADEVPPIDGDPITDSQEYPALFSVREAKTEGEASAVPVRYDDSYLARTVRFELRRENGEWRIDELEYEHGTPFTALLAMKPGE
jgi:hypothetical protein